MYWGCCENDNERENEFCNMIAEDIYNLYKEEFVKYIAKQVESYYDAIAEDIKQTIEHVCNIHNNGENTYYSVMNTDAVKYIEQAVKQTKYKIMLKINKKLLRLRKVKFTPSIDFISYQDQLFEFNSFQWCLDRGFIIDKFTYDIFFSCFSATQSTVEKGNGVNCSNNISK